MAVISRVKGAFTFGSDLWDPEHRFQTSWLLSPKILFFVRALFVGLSTPRKQASRGPPTPRFQQPMNDDPLHEGRLLLSTP